MLAMRAARSLACRTAMKQPLIIIPTYNEKDNVRPITALVFKACHDAHVLIVDDNSPDGTGAIADAMSKEDSRVHVLRRPGKQGLGRAYIAGFKWALERQYTHIFEMDADASHNPAEIPNFLKASEQADLVLGSRYINGIRIINWPLKRLAISKAASLYVQWFTRMPFMDPTGGYKCFRRAVLEAIDLDKVKSNGYSFQIEMTHTAWKLGFKIVEIPIIFEDRHAGASKMNGAIVREAIWIVLKLPWRSAAARQRKNN